MCRVPRDGAGGHRKWCRVAVAAVVGGVGYGMVLVLGRIG